jgi:hypothetical protein
MLGSTAVGATIGAVSGTLAGVLTNHLFDQHPIKGGGLSRHNVLGGNKTADVASDGPKLPSDPGRPSTGGDVAPQPGGPKLDAFEFAGAKGVDLGAGDAWPFKVANQLGLSQNDSIELARQNGFSFRDGMYWKGGRIMNPEEMKWHNIGLADIAAKRFQG